MKINSKILDKFEVDKNRFKKYLNKIKNFNIKNVEKKDLKEIVKLYLYILDNRTKVKIYKLSYIELLLNNFRKVISNVVEFSIDKQKSIVLDFINNCYKEINASLNINKEKLTPYKIINTIHIISLILEEIKQEVLHTKENIEILIKGCKNSIYDRINYSKFLPRKYLDKLLIENKEMLNQLIMKTTKSINKLCTLIKLKYDETQNEFYYPFIWEYTFKKKQNYIYSDINFELSKYFWWINCLDNKSTINDEYKNILNIFFTIFKNDCLKNIELYFLRFFNINLYKDKDKDKEIIIFKFIEAIFKEMESFIVTQIEAID